MATRRSLVADLRELGIRPGQTVMVHAGVRSVGPILGGATTLVQALLEAIGEDGTLVAYVDWELGFDPCLVDASLEIDVPAFDKRIARAARANGILPEIVRTWPGSIRSDHPDAGVAAIGPRADWLCENHLLSYGYGEHSPFAKLVEIGATVVTIGAPLDTMTLLHHAEHLARIPNKRIKRYRRKVLVGQMPSWVSVEEFDTEDPVVEGMPDDHFARIARRAVEAGCGRAGVVGAAVAHAFSAADLVRIGVEWLEAWRPADTEPV